MTTNILRVVVLLFGGAVVGIGLPILWERTKMWMHMGYARTGARSAYLLLIVNALVLTYITFDVVSRWDMGFSWRIPLALIIFGCKAMMLLSIRQATLQQQHALAVEGKYERRATERRAAPERRCT